jgi:chromate transporter
MMFIFKLLQSLAMLWHTFAFAAGGVYVFHAYRVLFYGGFNPTGVKVIRSADWQLWLSGLMIIGLGIVIDGTSAYAENPKLWAKVILIIIWLISTQAIRRYAAAKMRTGYRIPMLLASSVNVTCWIYGAFLGIAKPLAFGVMSFKSLLLGFDIVLLLSLCVTITLENRR